MKVLLAHNFYQASSPSGEDMVFHRERELLVQNSITVVTYEKNNSALSSSLKKLAVVFDSLWSKTSFQELSAIVARERPDVAHFHNIWYRISPAAYYACRDAGVPVVQSLHNFRMFCANGLLMRKGEVCEECLGTVPWRSVAYGCYRESRVYSFPLFAAEWFHKIRETWINTVSAYIALTPFGKRKYIECGLPEERIFTKPNFLASPPEPDYVDAAHAIFLGRLSHEKGVETLLSAIRILAEPERRRLSLNIIGDGPLKKKIEHTAACSGLKSILFVGRLPHNECLRRLAKSTFLILPSVCYENFPLAILEAFACGKAVVASRLGAMAELVEEGKTGLLFEPGNAEDLALKLKWMIDNEDACVQMGKNARAEFEAKYTAERNYELLMQIYQKAIKGEGASG